MTPELLGRLQGIADSNLAIIEALATQVRQLAEVAQLHQMTIDALTLRVTELEKKR